MQWFQKLFRKKDRQQGIVGISFLPHGITIAIADYIEDKGLRLTHCEFSETKKTDDYAAILKHWIQIYRLNNHDCHLVLDSNDYLRINIEAPNVPVSEMCSAIRWKINDSIDFPVDEAILDYYPVPFNETIRSGENRATLEVIVCHQSVLKPLVEHCLDADLNLKVIDIQETALRNLATLLPNSHIGGVAVLYLQKSSGIILIQKKGVIYVARKIVIGYEKLDLENSLTNTNGYYGNLSLEMDQQAQITQDNLALEIQRSLDYVDNHYGIGTVAELAVIPWAENSQLLVDRLNDYYGVYSYLADLSLIMMCDLGYEIQSLCLPVIGATLRNTVEHDSTAS